MLSHPTTGRLVRPGADLYFETQGSGPAVLILQGGVGHAGTTAQLAAELHDSYTVVTYDRRGLGRSTQNGPSTAGDRISAHAGDAAAVLAEVTGGAAHVVGASVGALIGLQMIAQTPGCRIIGLLAHEPPLESLVDDLARSVELDAIAETSRIDVIAAISRFAALTGADDPVEDGQQPAPAIGDPRADLEGFFRHDFHAVRAAAPPLPALTKTQVPILVTGGTYSRGRFEYKSAQALTAALGAPTLTEIIGGHNPLVSHPHASAAALRSWFARCGSSR